MNLLQKYLKFKEMLSEASNSDYHGEHTSPDPESGAPLHNLSGIYPDDFYTKPHHYGEGRDFDNESLSVMKAAKGRPMMSVKIYRAVPKILSHQEKIDDLDSQMRHILRTGKIPPNAKTNLTNRFEYYNQIHKEHLHLLANPPESEPEKIKINPGDWVTASRSYAKEHGESNLNNNYKILSKTVPASSLYTDGSIHEFGWHPKKANEMNLFEQYKKLIEIVTEVASDIDHPMIEHNGKTLHKTNSEGKLIHHTDDGIKAFHDWFGDSKVVDKHGRPTVVYHGSVNKSITQFDTNASAVRPRTGPNGTYFTSSQGNASNYAKHPIASGIKERGSITHAYLSFKSPLDITKDIKKHEKSGLSFGDAKKKALEKLDPEKHDSVIFRGNGMNHDEYIALNPNQIKSAIGNSGKFSPESKNINESDDDQVKNFRDKWNSAGVDNFVYGSSGSKTIGLSSIKVPKHVQNKGIGSTYMKDLNVLGDKLGKTITLSPSTDFGASKTRLLKFYKSHGYVENKGRNKDFSISDTMYRTPQKYAGQEEHRPEKIEDDTAPPLKPTPVNSVSKYSKSKEFRDWFSGSKVATPMGDPIVAYHGTPDVRGIRSTKQFHEKPEGIFFSNDMKTANSYAKNKHASDYQNSVPGIVSAHLHMRNPLIHDHKGKEWFGTDKIIKDAKEKGHDGVIINNVLDHYNQDATKKIRPSSVYVVFKNEQIHHI